MQFNNTSGKTGLMQLSEDYCGFADGGITGDANLLKKFTGYINREYHRVATMILQSMDESDYDDINHSDYPILTANLEADKQDYVLPASEKILQIKRIELTYDGSEWNKATPFSLSERERDTDDLDDLSKDKPLYDVRYNAIWLYPIPDTNVTDGLKYWVTREVEEFTSSDTTKEPGIDEPFHEMLAIGASLRWLKINRPESTVIDVLETDMQDYELRLRQHYGSKQQDRHYIMKRGVKQSEYK